MCQALRTSTVAYRVSSIFLLTVRTSRLLGPRPCGHTTLAACVRLGRCCSARAGIKNVGLVGFVRVIIYFSQHSMTDSLRYWLGCVVPQKGDISGFFSFFGPGTARRRRGGA